MPYEIRISVKKLAEFLLQSGSLDNRFGGVDRASEGARIHRRLQKEGGESYQAEVFLSQQTERNGFLYRVEGRADGVITSAGGMTIDEIKTTAAPFSMLTEDFNHAHWGQAMCYAHFYCKQQGITQISVQLTYFQVDTEEIRRFRRRVGNVLPTFVGSIREMGGDSEGLGTDARCNHSCNAVPFC